MISPLVRVVHERRRVGGTPGELGELGELGAPGALCAPVDDGGSSISARFDEGGSSRSVTLGVPQPSPPKPRIAGTPSSGVAVALAFLYFAQQFGQRHSILNAPDGSVVRSKRQPYLELIRVLDSSVSGDQIRQETH